MFDSQVTPRKPKERESENCASWGGVEKEGMDGSLMGWEQREGIVSSRVEHWYQCSIGVGLFLTEYQSGLSGLYYNIAVCYYAQLITQTYL